MERAVNRPLLCPKIIGRTPEFAALGLLVEQAKGGQGHIALIAGEAGIGKSRLVTELKTTAVAQGFLVVQGACFPTDLTYPYAPLLDLLRALVASNPKASLTAAVETLARDIFPLLPELVPDQTTPPPRLEPEQEKRRLFAVLATFFLHLSTHSPVLLIIEDVHWSDETSLDFLHYLTRRSASQPLLLLVTYRHEEMQPELSSWLAQLDRERLAHEVRLAPLSRSEVDTMLSAIFEERHTSLDMRRFLHGELLDTLYTLTEGNPFFVEETINSLIAAGDIFYIQGYWNRRSGSEVSIPRSVQDAVQRRTARVGEAARYVLTLAAVAGRHFDFALLQQLTQYDEHQLLLLMKALVAAQLVVEEAADQFAFRHALTRQAIYTQLLTRERRMLHRTIAETMEHQPPVTPDLHLEDLAYHFYQARDWQKAMDYAQRAGEKALGLYAHRAAVDYFTWALEAIDHLARGQAYETLGEFDQAQHDYTQALDAARKMNNRAAEWQSAIDLGFLWAGRDYAQAETWFRQALILSQSLDDPALHARSLNRIGNWHLNVEQPHEALRYHREALTIFQQLQDSRGIAETLDLLGMTSYLGGDLVGGTTYYQQANALFGELGDKPGLTSSLATLTLRGPTYQTDSLVSAASLAEVCQDAEHALMIAREIGHRSAESRSWLSTSSHYQRKKKDHLMNAIDILKYGQLTVLQAIDGFPETAWETPGACGVWSVKDIIAHLASYEEVLVDVLSGFVGRHPTPSLDKFTELGGQFNDTEVERRKRRTVKEVLDEFNDAHAQVMSLAERIRPEVFRHTGTLPWYGMEYALDDVLVYMYYGHKREHSAQIAAFRDRQK